MPGVNRTAVESSERFLLGHEHTKSNKNRRKKGKKCRDHNDRRTDTRQESVAGESELTSSNSSSEATTGRATPKGRQGARSTPSGGRGRWIHFTELTQF